MFKFAEMSDSQRLAIVDKDFQIYATKRFAPDLKSFAMRSYLGPYGQLNFLEERAIEYLCDSGLIASEHSAYSVALRQHVLRKLAFVKTFVDDLLPEVRNYQVVLVLDNQENEKMTLDITYGELRDWYRDVYENYLDYSRR
jgi:hypothetical protein